MPGPKAGLFRHLDKIGIHILTVEGCLLSLSIILRLSVEVCVWQAQDIFVFYFGPEVVPWRYSSW